MHGVSLDQPGMMLYTSGTSGNPKGVPLTHRNVAVNGLDWLKCNAPLLEEHDVDLLWLPMSHIFGFGEACLGNTLGFTTYLVDPRVVLEQLPIVRPSVFMSVPSIWEKLATTAMHAHDPRVAPGQARRGHRRSPALLPLGRRGPQARGEGVLVRARACSSSRATGSPRPRPR